MPESFPHAICHLDADCFYASVEIIYNPAKEGKPFAVISHVGGIVLSSSYEARKFGVKVGVPVWEAEKKCPGITFEPANFPRYVLHSIKMMEMLRSFTPDVEEYSIDEAFFDLTHVRDYFKLPYEQIAKNIQEKIWKELHLPVSIGVSINKTLAKLASDFKKPKGITVVPGEGIDEFITHIELNDIAGIGYHNNERLFANNITTVRQFVDAPASHIKKILGIGGLQLQMELRGVQALSIQTEKKKPKSISRSRTFHTQSKSIDFLLAELLLHLQEVVARLRSHHLSARTLSIFLRRQERYKYSHYAISLDNYTDDTLLFAIQLEPMLRKIFEKDVLYRSSGLVLNDLVDTNAVVDDVFAKVDTEHRRNLSSAIDELNKRYGKKTIVVGASTIEHEKSNKEEEKEAQKEELVSYRGRFISL